MRLQQNLNKIEAQTELMEKNKISQYEARNKEAVERRQAHIDKQKLIQIEREEKVVQLEAARSE